jgi:hypothetical protein
MLVNGHRVKQAMLDDGAEVKIGNTVLTIRHVADKAPTEEGRPGV